MSNTNVSLEQNELEKLQQQQQMYTKTLIELGSIELLVTDLKERLKHADEEKSNLLNDIKTLKEQAEDFQKELVEKYGNIDVDLNTGEYKNLN